MPLLPETIKILNISNNCLTELTIPINSEYINANSNKIIQLHINNNSLGEELYISNNKLESLDTITRLSHLKILDISDNCISYYEDVAILSFNTRLQILSILNNPISIFSNDPITEIITGLKDLDPLNIFQFSKCPHTSILLNQSIQTHKRNYTLPLNFVEIPTIRQPCKPNFKTPNRQSRASSPSLHCFSTTNKSVCYNTSPLSKENMLDRKAMNYSQRRSSSLLITPENIAQASKVKYGNPIAALMIKPGSKRRIQRRK